MKEDIKVWSDYTKQTWFVTVPSMDCPSTNQVVQDCVLEVIKDKNIGWYIQKDYNDGNKFFSVDGKWMSEKELNRYSNKRVVKDYFPSCWAAFACIEDRYSK